MSMHPNQIRVGRLFVLCQLLLLGAAFPATTSAQASGRTPAQRLLSDARDFDGSSFGEPVAIGPDWLFMPGDTSTWSMPELNDSAWTVISSSRPLAAYGFHDLRYGWYRVHIRLRPGVHHLSVAVSDLHGSYEIFVNGVHLGSAGDPAGMVKYTKFGMRSYPVPDRLIGPEGRMVLAIRVAFNAAGITGKGTSTPIDATSNVLLMDGGSATHEASYIDVHNTVDSLVLAFLSLIVGLVALALFTAMPTRREYLAAAIALLASSLEASLIVWERADASTFALYVARYLCLAARNVALIEFVRLIVRHRRTLWLSILQVFSFFAPFCALLAVLGIGSIYFAFAAFFVPLLVTAGVQVALLTKGSLRGNVEARVLLPAPLALGLVLLWDFVGRLLFFTHLTSSVASAPELRIGSFSFDIFWVASFLFYFTILLFLVLRTVVIARERARIGAELEAARTTQELLMSKGPQTTPGFEVQSVYHPASEVGGDFFLISSSAEESSLDNALVVIVGDVSGKGLTAAMRVAMILGVLRREESRRPGDILRSLNAALWNETVSGFTTACCVRFEPDGRYTLANAGHIAPYIDGQEVDTPPALPLGLEADQLYGSVTGKLLATQKLVLLSDGVLEAQSSSGELLGFARLAALTTKSAHAIADAARNFGQEDDITVVTITKLAVA